MLPPIALVIGTPSSALVEETADVGKDRPTHVHLSNW